MKYFDNKQLRLFFALWPDNGVRNELVQINKKLAKQTQGKQMRSENLHITLAFLGNVPADSLDCLLPIAKNISFTPFELKLDHLGSFPRAQIIWAGIKNEPEPLMTLSAELYKGVAACGIHLKNQPFKPHLTLMREVKQLTEFSFKPVYWSVNNFHLVSSVSKPEGAEYHVLHRWP